MPIFNTGIVTRISNLIILQVIFIFGALALFLFGGNPESVMKPEVLNQEQSLVHPESIASQLVQQSLESVEKRADLSQELSSLLASDQSIQYAAIVRLPENNNPIVEYSFLSHDATGTIRSATEIVPDFCEIGLLRSVSTQDAGYIVRKVHDSRFSVYYDRLKDINNQPPAILVAVVDHGLFVSSRANMQYSMLLLFLISALISLLTIYLMAQRFREPLQRLITGFEKTAEGELFYLVEPFADDELKRLTETYNLMAQKLWDNQKELKAYNIQLKKSNLAILKSQLFLSASVDCSPLPVIVVDSSGRVMLFNRAASDVFGYSSEEIVGGEMSNLLDGSEQDVLSRESFSENKETRDNPVGEEAICCRKDGELFPVFVVSSLVYTGEGDSGARIYVIRDISESKRFQEMMVRLDRYCTRGEMAGDIAHEINNYLAVLMGNLELLPIFLKKGKMEKVVQKLDVMKTTTDKIARFANGLMDTPQDEMTFELTSINQVVENVLAFLKPQSRFRNIEIIPELSSDLPLIQSDQGQLQQLLVNLINNASDAINENESDQIIRICTFLNEEMDVPGVTVDVIDNGPGVPKEKVDCLFTERFTTKRKGHGIGLVTCRRLVENHDGKIEYRFQDGAVFSFTLPLNQLDHTDKQEKPTSVEHPGTIV